MNHPTSPVTGSRGLPAAISTVLFGYAAHRLAGGDGGSAAAHAHGDSGSTTSLLILAVAAVVVGTAAERSVARPAAAQASRTRAGARNLGSLAAVLAVGQGTVHIGLATLLGGPVLPTGAPGYFLTHAAAVLGCAALISLAAGTIDAVSRFWRTAAGPSLPRWPSPRVPAFGDLCSSPSTWWAAVPSGRAPPLFG